MKRKLPEIYTESSIKLLESRFLKTDKKGNPTETPADLFQRVAKEVANSEKLYKTPKNKQENITKEFFDILFNLKFIPNSPTLLNAGKEDKTLSGCFVLPIEDSLDHIYKTLSDAVQVQWKGGGTGFNFSEIRPKGDQAAGIPDVAAGPVHFIKTFSEALMGIRQGGKRGGANMAILNVDHPDILDFIHLKERDRTIMNFNISVGITDEFMKAVQNDEKYALINPRNNKKVDDLNARYVFNEIVQLSHKTGDPGICFIENLEKANKTPNVGTINATNPCGEQPLLPYESCNLGHINLRAHFNYRKKDLHWDNMKDTIHKSVRFLDNVIDINYYPIKEIEKMTRETNRKIGLGVMGFADVLMLRQIPYSSNEACKYAEKIMSFIQKEGEKASTKLAKKRGTFGAYKGSVWEKQNTPLRNAAITTVAPTGNTSIIGGSSGGIEPAYALAYRIGGVEDKNYQATKVLFKVNQAFVYLAKRYDFYSKELVAKLADGVPASQIPEIPEKFKNVFLTAHEIDPIWHLKMQEAFQKHVDSAISKTINFKNNATEEDVRKVYIEAFKKGLKGVTIFRDGCKGAQTYVSTKKSKLNVEDKKKEIVEKLKLIIGSKDETKIKDIETFIKEQNEDFEIVKASFEKPSLKDAPKRTSEKNLSKRAKIKSLKIGKQVQKHVLADESGIVFKNAYVHNKMSDIIYYGKNGNYSEKLFKKVISYKGNDGKKAYISCALSLFNPKTEHMVTTSTAIPGKLINIDSEKHKKVFIHEGLDIFSTAPSEEEFKSYHHRYKALQKLFEKYKTFKKDSIQINLSKNAYHVLEKRALRKDESGNIVETPRQLFKRIAKYVASASEKYGYSNKEIKETEKKFFTLLKDLKFQCGGALIWAGMSNEKGQKAIWSKCFVLPIKDTIPSIFSTLNDNIEVLRHGGGTGFNFSEIRSKHVKVSTTGEKAAGPVRYLKVFNNAQNTIVGRGGRQMGSMAILNIDHPDIEEFIKAKEEENVLQHYNLSVGITDEFIKALKADDEWELVDPHTKEVIKKVNAKNLFEKISKHAWGSGDPGVIFIDKLEKDNPTPNLGKINATNVCGEQPLLPYESCNLGNISLSKLVKGFPYLEEDDFHKRTLRTKLKYIDWEKFEESIDASIEFLDNVIDINNYPIPEIERMTKKTRSIGLGVMGFADLLVKLGIPYESEEAVKVAKKIMKFLTNKSHETSKRLGKKRGNFPGYKGSRWDSENVKHIRNSRCTTVAPTGTVSIIADCNPGIEPIFALCYKRKQSLGGEEQVVTEKLFEKVAKHRGFYSKKIMDKLADGEKLSNIENIPPEVVKLFKTSHEIDPLQHVKIQAAFQEHCDSAVSKTINLPNSAKVEDIEKVYQLAYDLDCKGITVFRDGCKKEAQTTGLKDKKKKSDDEVTIKKIKDPRNRPTTTTGLTTQVKTDQGSLYVTINEDEDGIAEVFLNIGKSGGYASGYCEAIGRLVSVSLRAGLPLEVIVDQLKGIRTSAPTLNKGMFVYSVPDAVAKVLEGYIKDKEGKISMFKDENKIEVKTTNEIEKLEEEESKANVDSEKEEDDSKEVDSKYSKDNELDMLPECPDCGGDLMYAEGCMMCQGCGYSKCG